MWSEGVQKNPGWLVDFWPQRVPVTEMRGTIMFTSPSGPRGHGRLSPRGQTWPEGLRTRDCGFSYSRPGPRWQLAMRLFGSQDIAPLTSTPSVPFSGNRNSTKTTSASRWPVLLDPWFALWSAAVPSTLLPCLLTPSICSFFLVTPRRERCHKPPVRRTSSAMGPKDRVRSFFTCDFAVQGALAPSEAFIGPSGPPSESFLGYQNFILCSFALFSRRIYFVPSLNSP